MDPPGTIVRGDLLVRDGVIVARGDGVPAALAALPGGRAEESVDADWQDNEYHPESAPAPSEGSFFDDAHRLALTMWRTKFPLGFLKSDDSFVKALRSQLAREDEGMRGIMRVMRHLAEQRLRSEVPEEEREYADYEGAYDCIIREVRAALREPDGRKGE